MCIDNKKSVILALPLKKKNKGITGLNSSLVISLRLSAC